MDLKSFFENSLQGRLNVPKTKVHLKQNGSSRKKLRKGYPGGSAFNGL
jgi:hypothetical protein